MLPFSLHIILLIFLNSLTVLKLLNMCLKCNLTTQIQELHRLYGRQRELMDERRDELHKHDLRFEVACSKIALSQSSSQKSLQAPSLPLVDLSHTRMSVSGPGHTQSPVSVVQGKNMQAFPYPARSEGCSKDVQIFESKCKKVGKKILDLQLPADEYIDSEECELLDNEKIAEVPEVTSHPLRRLPQDMCNSDGKPVLEGTGLNSVFYGDAPSPASVLNKLRGLEKLKGSTDLIEPEKLEEEAAPMSDSFKGPTNQRELLCCEVPVGRKSGFQVSSKGFLQNSQILQDLEACSILQPSHTESKQEWLSCNDEAGENLNARRHYL